MDQNIWIPNTEPSTAILCPLGLSHELNEETIASIEASERSEGIKRFKSIDDLFENLGI